MRFFSADSESTAGPSVQIIFVRFAIRQFAFHKQRFSVAGKIFTFDDYVCQKQFRLHAKISRSRATVAIVCFFMNISEFLILQSEEDVKKTWSRKSSRVRLFYDNAFYVQKASLFFECATFSRRKTHLIFECTSFISYILFFTILSLPLCKKARSIYFSAS